MQKIDFSSAVLTRFERTTKEGRAHFSASLTESLKAAMGWGDLPDGAISTKMDGNISAQTAVLKPMDVELKQHALDMDITGVESFSIVRLEVERTKGVAKMREVRFVVTFAAPDTCALLESYMLRLGEAKAKLTISYVKQANLHGNDADAPDDEVGE